MFTVQVLGSAVGRWTRAITADAFDFCLLAPFFGRPL